MRVYKRGSKNESTVLALKMAFSETSDETKNDQSDPNSKIGIVYPKSKLRYWRYFSGSIF